jgi:hypothetical protein
MKLPLTCEPSQNVPGIVRICDADGELLAAAYGDDALARARDLVNAVNEQPALKEKVARLEELIKKWR